MKNLEFTPEKSADILDAVRQIGVVNSQAMESLKKLNDALIMLRATLHNTPTEEEAARRIIRDAGETLADAQRQILDTVLKLQDLQINKMSASVRNLQNL